MNINDMGYFICLFETKSYTKTAQFFHVSQPSISYAVKRMEKELQTTLFIRDRSHNNIQLTKNGALFYDYAKHAVKEYHNLVKQILKSENKRTLNVGLPNMVAASYMSKLYSESENQGISKCITYINDSSYRLFEKIKRGELDFMLCSAAGPLGVPGFRSKKIYRKPFEIVVSKDHPFAKRKRVSLLELEGESFILLSPESRHYAIFKEIMKRKGLRLSIVHQNRDIHIIRTMVANNNGISFLADVDLIERKNPDLRYLQIKDSDIPTLDFYVVYPESNNQLYSKLIQIFYALFH